jgi:LytS/YehU family sensor histidine kinase
MASILKDTWIRVTVPSILVILSLSGQRALQLPMTYERIGTITRLIFFIAVNFEIGRYIVLLVRKKYPTLALTKKRVIISYFLNIIATLGIITISTIVSRLYIDKLNSFLSESFVNFLQTFWISMLIVAPYEALYSYFLSLRSEQEKEKLLKANIQGQLHSLQTQINPHFLFNSLNTLSALTIKDPYKAEEFVIEMSAVYRYLLKSNTEQTTTLKKELDFIYSFLHLLNTRFEKGLNIHISINSQFYNHRLPPLTLQLLVENVVKHNEIAEDQPIQINIYIDTDNKLIISNTLRKKAKALDSTGFGLSNIVSRYQLLQQPQVIITEVNNEFRVVLPLLKPSENESADY